MVKTNLGPVYGRYWADNELNSENFILQAEKDIQKFLMLLKISPNAAKVLDVPCGTGRHARVLASHGYEVTAIDISLDCLAIANSCNKKNISYEQADMFDLKKYYGKFSAVFNLYNSFGYFSKHEQNQKSLAEMVNCLDHGYFVMNIANKAKVLEMVAAANYQYILTKGNYQFRFSNQYDVATSSIHTVLEILSMDGIILETNSFSCVLYSYEEIIAWLEKLNMKEIIVFGNEVKQKPDATCLFINLISKTM